MRLRPTEGRPTLELDWKNLVWDAERFERYLLVAKRTPTVRSEGAARTHAGEELRHLATIEGQPPSLYLRRLPRADGGPPPTRMKQLERRAGLQNPCLPALHETGFRDGYVFEVSTYVFGVGLEQLANRRARLPWVVAAAIFRELLSALTEMRAKNCLPHCLLQARNLRFSLLEQSAAVAICCNPPLPGGDTEERARPEPYFGAQMRAVIRLLMSIAAPADETQRMLLLDESAESADVLADHIQATGLPLEPLSVAKMQMGSMATRQWLERRKKRELLTANDDDRAALRAFWQQAYELSREDREALADWSRRGRRQATAR